MHCDVVMDAARRGVEAVDLRFMAEALEEAGRAADAGEVPVGAVLVGPDGTVLARAGNGTVTLTDPSAHAEILALRQGASAVKNYRLEGATLYVTVEPCAMCAGSLVWARVARLVYGAPDPKGGAVDSLFGILRDGRLNHTVEVTGGVRADECRALMQRFFEKRRGDPPADGLPRGVGRKQEKVASATGDGEVPKRS